MKPKIIIAGSIIVDKIVTIDSYPEKNMCSKILHETRNAGGCVCNTACDLAIIDNDLPVYASAFVGNDDDGDFAIAEMNRYGVDTSLVKRNNDTFTSHAIVLSDGGSRTFLSSVGTNAYYSIEDVLSIDFNKGDYFHMGYLSLLDNMDSKDEEYGTKAARTLFELQKRGVKTSIDMVSNDDGKIGKIAKCSLKYCDNVIINEIEGGFIAGLSPYKDGELCNENVYEILKTIKNCGVKDKVIIHSANRAFCLDNEGCIYIDSIKHPKGWIKSTTGAGDAFCAGALYGLCHGYSPEQILNFANCTATYSLSAGDSISGMKQLSEINKMMDKKSKKGRKIC